MRSKFPEWAIRLHETIRSQLSPDSGVVYVRWHVGTDIWDFAYSPSDAYRILHTVFFRYPEEIKIKSQDGKIASKSVRNPLRRPVRNEGLDRFLKQFLGRIETLVVRKTVALDPAPGVRKIRI